MKLRMPIGRALREGAMLAAVLALASPVAPAATPSEASSFRAASPASATALPHELSVSVAGVTLGGSFAPALCPNVPTVLAFRGLVYNSCERYLGYRFIPESATPTTDLLIVDLAVPCPDSTRGCLAAIGHFADSLVLPGRAPGARRLDVVVVYHSCADSLPRPGGDASFGYSVQDSCFGPPIPPVTPLPHGVQVAIGSPAPCDTCPPVACPNVPVKVRLFALEENTCVHYLGSRVLPLAGAPDRDVVLVRFATACRDSHTACLQVAHAVQDSFFLPAQGPGLHRLEVLVADSTCRDSVRVYPGRVFTYDVLDSCGGPPPPPPPPAVCVWPFLADPVPITADARICAVSIPAGGVGSFPLAVRSDGLRLAGLEGRVFAPQGPARLDHLELIGPAAGMHLQTSRPEDGSIRFVMWAEHGAPVPANDWVPVLRVFVRADSVRADSAQTGTRYAFVANAVTAASDSLGHAVPLCSIATIQQFAPVGTRICIGSAPSSCDANRDGAVNVADLVRMVRCWYRPAECPDTSAARPDCNTDGTFSPADLFCCARHMLGGPRDSTAHTPSALSFAFGTPVFANGRLDLPLTVRGGGDLGGALLRLTCPSDRYEWDDGITLAGPASWTDTGTDDNWLVFQDSDGGDRLLGLLRLGDVASDQVTTTLHLRLREGQQPGGAVTISESDLSGPDGRPLVLDLANVQAELPTAGGGTVTRLELSAARPNPTGGKVAFALALPQAATDVDLAVYDLAGRRVATLWRGALGAGARTFTWDGGAARDGVYFARLVVDGEVRSSRVVVRHLR
ncbi:MAG: FlgD immunoglobulin-like domain containing protein [Candidatus Eisenbacteria bacterium]